MNYLVSGNLNTTGHSHSTPQWVYFLYQQCFQVKIELFFGQCLFKPHKQLKIICPIRPLFVSHMQHSLAGSAVMVSKRAFQRLNRSRMAIFAQELAVLVFTKEGLAESTLTGKSGKGGPPKTQLDVEKVQAITGMQLFYMQSI